MIRVLLVGAGSFVGKNYIKHTHDKYIEEVSLFEIKPKDIDFSRFDIVIHLAAYVHQSRHINEDEYYRVNRDLSIEVAKNAKEKGIKQFIFLSTAKVYGDFETKDSRLNEESTCSPLDSYGKSKFAAEVGIRELEDENFIISIIRTPIIYGEGVKSNMFSIIRLVDQFCILPLKDINNKRSFTYVENMVGFINRIIEKKASGIFIVKDMYPLSTTKLVILISKNMQKKLSLIKLPRFILGIVRNVFPYLYKRLFTSFELDNQKTLEILEYFPPYTSEEGIRRTVEWYKSIKGS